MLNLDVAGTEEQHFLLSSLAPGSTQKRTALCIVLGLLVALYLITGPLSGIQLGAVNAFVAVYGTAMFVTDSITAFLLFAQFYIIRSRGILVIASGYLFTALVRSCPSSCPCTRGFSAQCLASVANARRA